MMRTNKKYINSAAKILSKGMSSLSSFWPICYSSSSKFQPLVSATGLFAPSTSYSVSGSIFASRNST